MIYVCYYSTPCDNAEVILATQNKDKAIDNVLTSKANTLQLWNDDAMIDECDITKEWEQVHTTREEIEQWLGKYITFGDFIDKLDEETYENIKRNKLKIGIALKEKNGDTIKRFKTIVSNLNECHADRIIYQRISKDDACIETDLYTYELFIIKYHFARGKRFHKVYFDSSCTREEIDNIIKPITNTCGYMDIYNTIEMIKHE